ncbi:uncharacterized protein K02A2.6-like [Lampris incognitus]|uniref:uncharacterized protein K02A2.6-like n=1 Tax=Lampris incognitus TaxID=2546036 RepID=UPI0024B4CF9A|nr:uncharacterized protein K02A2.6-like [Lampris incognitus]
MSRTGAKATIHVNADAVPRFFRPRSVPYAIRAKVDEEIDRLIKEGIITPVKYSDWAGPVVPILKPGGTVRLCGDYKLTVNTVSSLEQYPVPRVEDLFTALSGGKQFSQLDMSHAYQQILMDEESKKYLTVNTHRGLFTYNRLPFGGGASAPAIFQRTMESLLRGIPLVAVYLDDILVSGVDEADRLRNLDAVLTRLREAGLRLRRSKCTFMQEEVEYLGHRVDAQGLHPVKKRVKAIMEAPTPTNVTELKSYLGLLNYYNKFLPNLATLLAPLPELLRQDVRWMWKKQQEEAFQKSKGLLNSAAVLVHYSADRDVILSCDASPYGVGAVLSQRMEDGSERPVGFMSHTLSPVEKGYSQLDKEGLAVIFGIQKFRKYLYGRAFTIYTDHKPLSYLFNEKKPIPQMGSPRVQRWAVYLSAYEYKMLYKPGKQHANADAFSRLPVPETGQEGDTTEQVLMMDLLDDTLLDTNRIKRWTAKDVTLSRAHEYVWKGWPAETETHLKPYHQRRRELSVRVGCVLWGARVIILTKGRDTVLKIQHQTHAGMTRMKGLARSYVWWPGMDQDVEKEVQSCEECQTHQKAPPATPLHPWEWPEEPWSRIHVDYTGHFMGEMFLLIVDAHSKWMDIYPCEISHITSDNRETTYRITPHGTTGLSPAELMMSRRLRSTLDLLTPDVKTKDQQKQMKQKQAHDGHTKLRSLAPGDEVFIRNYSYGPKWIPAVVESLSGPVSYTVTVGSGQTMKWHVDQVQTKLTHTAPIEVTGRDPVPVVSTEGGSTGPLPTASDVSEEPPTSELLEPPPASEVQKRLDLPVVTEVRRSGRERHSPSHLKDFVRK